MTGFRIDLSANQGSRKFFFAARCDCGTAAVLSVEVAGDKTLPDLEQALPELTRGLQGRARAFHEMPCDAHRRMRADRAGI